MNCPFILCLIMDAMNMLFCVCVCRMSRSWEEAQKSVARDKKFLFTNRKKILLFPGLVS